MIKKTRKIWLLLLLLSAVVIQIGNVNAASKWDVSEKEASPGSSGGGGGGGVNKIENNRIVGVAGNKYYSCSFERFVGARTQYELRVYNRENKDIMQPELYIAETDRVLAGTPVGINLIENKVLVRWIRYLKIDIYETTSEPLIDYRCVYQHKTRTWYYHEESITATPSTAKCPDVKTLREPDENLGDIIAENYTYTRMEPYNLNEDGFINKNIPKKTLEYAFDITNLPEQHAGQAHLQGSNSFTKTNINQYQYVDGVPLATNPAAPSIEEQNMVTACLQKAIAWTTEIAQYTAPNTASYNVEVSDSNDANGTNAILIKGYSTNSSDNTASAEFYDHYGNKCAYTDWKKCRMDTSKYPTERPPFHAMDLESLRILVYDTRSMIFTYNMGKTCLNVKTAKASYKKKHESCTADEIEIPNETVTEISPTGETKTYEHWHYFIPLNAKNTDGIKMKMLNTSKLDLTKTQCERVMKDKANGEYVKYIKPKEVGKIFIGDYPSGTRDYQEITNNGCSLTSLLTLPVKQQFYNETETNTLNGFNFYYKPIDVSKGNQIDAIFPNGVSTDDYGNITTVTLWDDWYKAQNDPLASDDSKQPDLSKSYDTVTYVAQNISAKQIRDYNKDNPYTSWAKMRKEGTSSFIGVEKGVINRVGDPTANIYKLGCGPANSFEYYDEAKTIKNNLYIKGCELK